MFTFKRPALVHSGPSLTRSPQNFVVTGSLLGWGLTAALSLSTSALAHTAELNSVSLPVRTPMCLENTRLTDWTYERTYNVINGRADTSVILRMRFDGHRSDGTPGSIIQSMRVPNMTWDSRFKSVIFQTHAQREGTPMISVICATQGAFGLSLETESCNLTGTMRSASPEGRQSACEDDRTTRATEFVGELHVNY